MGSWVMGCLAGQQATSDSHQSVSGPQTENTYFCHHRPALFNVSLLLSPSGLFFGLLLSVFWSTVGEFGLREPDLDLRFLFHPADHLLNSFFATEEFGLERSIEQEPDSGILPKISDWVWWSSLI